MDLPSETVVVSIEQRLLVEEDSIIILFLWHPSPFPAIRYTSDGIKLVQGTLSELFANGLIASDLGPDLPVKTAGSRA